MVMITKPDPMAMIERFFSIRGKQKRKNENRTSNVDINHPGRSNKLGLNKKAKTACSLDNHLRNLTEEKPA